MKIVVELVHHEGRNLSAAAVADGVEGILYGRDGLLWIDTTAYRVVKAEPVQP